MNKKNVLIMALALVLVAAISVGGTIAWLAAKTDPVTNTFTVGNIDIELKEHDYIAETTDPTKFNTLDQSELVEKNEDYVIIPGTTLPKDPFVTVKGGSEACWLFVKVESTIPSNTNITWSVDGGWTQLTDADGKDVAGVYYREVGSSAAEQKFFVLDKNQIAISDNLTKYEVDQMTATNYTMTITAYAVQRANVANAYTAWGYTVDEYNDNADGLYSDNSNK